jgi:hypothetical protein
MVHSFSSTIKTVWWWPVVLEIAVIENEIKTQVISKQHFLICLFKLNNHTSASHNPLFNWLFMSTNILKFKPRIDPYF